MSARVRFQDAETVLAARGPAPRPGKGSLSVDGIKEQSCRNVAHKPCGHQRTFLDWTDEDGARHCNECFIADRSRPNETPKRCGHERTYGDWTDEDGAEHCHECFGVADKPEEPRRRLNRRRTAAGLLLRWKSPVDTFTGSAPDDRHVLDARNRGKWFPVSACGIVPWGPGMALEHRLTGRVERLGIFKCGSIWTCPCCAQHVAVARSKQVKTIIETARQQGFRVAMVTYTAPHDKCVPLRVSIARARDAMTRFTVHGTLRERRKGLGYVGHLVAMEITLALDEDRHDNGWHVHFHAIEIYEGAGVTSRQDDAAWALKVKCEVFETWKRCVLASGSPRPPSFKYGLDVKVVWTATDYPVKSPEAAEAKQKAGKKRWGAENEMTKGYLKERSAEAKSRMPFQLLDTGERRDEELFLEYAKATFGRRQLEWSRGARDIRRLFGAVDHRTDEQLVVSDPEWVFDDEPIVLDEDGKVVEPALPADFVIERVDIAADDAWRARRYSRGSLDRAIRDVEDAELSLSEALRQQGWVLTTVSESSTIMEPTYDDETGEMLFEDVFIYATEDDDFETGMHFRPVLKPIHVPKKSVATFPVRTRTSKKKP
ncbi:hypothetical protein SPHINGOT1_260296 [Sphingomonas sp. T1]|nr:hypothetical protein SPHINGOT1_260296 [Sphingomonas sp. T1]